MALKVADYSNDNKESMLGSKLYLGHEMMKMKAQSRAFSLGRNVTVSVSQKTISTTITENLADTGDTISSLTKTVTLDSDESLIVLEVLLEESTDSDADTSLTFSKVRLTPDGEDDPVIDVNENEPIYSPEWLHGDFEIEVTFEEYTSVADDEDIVVDLDIFTLSAENVQ